MSRSRSTATEGFGQEEVDAVTSFADLASLLLRNARLYGDADGDGGRAPPCEPPQGPLPPEREPRAAHAPDGDRRLDGPLRGGGPRREDDAAGLAADPAVRAGAARADRRPARSRPPRARGADAQLEAVSLSEVIQRSVETVRLMAEIPGRRPDSRPAARAHAPGARGRLRAPAGPLEPARQRDPVHAPARPRRRARRARARALPRQRGGRRHRHPRERAAARLRAVPPGRRLGDPRPRRHGHRPRARAVARRAAREGRSGRRAWSGQGSRFTFALPIRPAERRASELPPRRRPGRPGTAAAPNRRRRAGPCP